MIRDLLVRSSASSEGTPLVMLRPDLDYLTSPLLSLKEEKVPHLDITAGCTGWRGAQKRESGNQTNILFFLTPQTLTYLFKRSQRSAMISPLDGERPLFRSLPKNCMEKNIRKFQSFLQNPRWFCLVWHISPAHKTTWYVIHTSVKCDINSQRYDASDILSFFSFSGRTNTLAPTSCISETTLPMQRSQMFLSQCVWWTKWVFVTLS